MLSAEEKRFLRTFCRTRMELKMLSNHRVTDGCCGGGDIYSVRTNFHSKKTQSNLSIMGEEMADDDHDWAHTQRWQSMRKYIVIKKNGRFVPEDSQSTIEFVPDAAGMCVCEDVERVSDGKFVQQ